jgi:aspartate/methionine/tyrosine aminotransferase
MKELGAEFFDDLRADYQVRRDFLVSVLRDVGFEVSTPAGTYFALCDFTKLFDGDDREFARHLIETVGVAAIPPSAFYTKGKDEGRKLIRFAYCKEMSTLEAAAERLRKLKP